MTESGKLKVGRASAGSGKTFTLTLEYLTLLVENPDNYRHILAVTFTNKATAEMKSRIIETLYKVATGDPSARIFEEKLQGKTGQGQTVVRDRCRLALSKILHDYSHFRIETIDSFFQSIIRDLARELNLTANLNVDLNSDEALEEAVAQMIERMKEGDEVYNAVLAYVEDNLEAENKNWKIDAEVTEFSRNIFNENYLKEEKNINELTGEPGFYSRYKQSLYAERDRIDSLRKDNARQFVDYCDGHGFGAEDFVRGRSGVYAFLPKIADGNMTGSVPKALKDDHGAPWMKDSGLDSEHQPYYLQLFDNEMALRRKRNTVDTILQYVNQMSLLNKVDTTLRQLNKEKNRFILADTAHKLNDIISDNDIPFIYEKAASSFRYIMIDEFQDTSELQWKNFIPLIKECISGGHTCLIVGDVKQSIYRWRNSDWAILNNINTDKNFSAMVEEEEMRKALDTNHRSDGNIVEFNNWFFSEAGRETARHFTRQFGESGLTEAIRLAYNEVKQKIRKGHEGKGYVEVIDVNDTERPDDGGELTKEKYRQHVLELLGETLTGLYGQGVEEGDIAILTRYNSELQLISKYLKRQFKGINIVSNEAYRLDSSEAVRLIVAAMRVIAGYDSDAYRQGRKPFNMFLCATLAYEYQTAVMHSHYPIDRFYQAEDRELYGLLPDSFIGSISELQTLPLYELCERIYSLFTLDRLDGQSAYLFYFMDQVAAFAKDNSADIDSFTQYWDDRLYCQTIPAGETEGLHMMTIHKSKGLEFHTVIIPFCDWSMEIKNPVIWCRSAEEGQLPVIPVKCRKTTGETDFSHDYEEEVMKNYVDNQNLLYVAFTRASHNLIIMTGNFKEEKEKKDRDSGYTVYNVIKNTIGDRVQFPVGEVVRHKEEAAGGEDGNSDIRVRFVNTGKAPVFRQSNRSREFISDEDGPDDETHSYIKKGLVVHKVFSMINSEDDIDRVLRQLDQEGVMEDRAFRDCIDRAVGEAMADERIREWFSPRWKVINERDIVTGTDDLTQTRRPDRVIYDDRHTIVIDYKTGSRSAAHRQQVRDYMKLLTGMGMPGVEGYIWYMKYNEVERIEDNV